MFRKIENRSKTTTKYVTSLKAERSNHLKIAPALFIMAILASLPLAADRFGKNLLTFQFNTNGESLVTTGPDFKGNRMTLESDLVRFIVDPKKFGGEGDEAVFYLPGELLRAIASKDLETDIIASYEVSDRTGSAEIDRTGSDLQTVDQNQAADSVEASETLTTSFALTSPVPKQKKVLHCHDHNVASGNEWHCHEG
ncbi:MAG: hypothetical protein KTR32_35125 [Granulosicoccus sp.]|nr:hypothetical protein [Granulosicoccus sp.]